MGMIIGIDVGISTTKIVGVDNNGVVISPLRIKATDPVTSLYGAFGKYLYDNNINLSDVERVMLTGVGSAYINSPIYGLPTDKADEFIADGLGARYETDLERMIVVSMGTGTSLVKCDKDEIQHIGGIGIGGGTLQGLARVLLKTEDIQQVSDLAMQGDISNINLLIGDISAKPLPGLPMDATASLFGKAMSNAQREDLALGIIYMVLQSIGSGAILSALGTNIKDFVLIGNLTLLPQCQVIFPAMEKLYGVRFRIPEHSQFSTAIGAALHYYNKTLSSR
ncbi:MAG: type II pantothenate kinase [Prevotella sp.]|nr:type II pantothenate kinase [Prevotella sp.]